MRKEKPMPGFITKIIFIMAVLKAFFNRDEQVETADDLLAIMGSTVRIGFCLVAATSILSHVFLKIPMILTVPLSCFILAPLYHLCRVIHVQKKSLL